MSKIDEKTLSQTQEDEDPLFSWDGTPSLADVIPLGLQHVLASAMGVVAPAIIIAAVCGLSRSDETMLIQASLIMTGLASLIQLFPIGRHIGSGLPIIMGAAFAYVPVLKSVGGSFGIGTILGAEIVGGIVAIIVGLLIKYIRPLFPSIVTGSVIFTIGLSLYPTAIRWMAGGEGNATFGSPANWCVALVTFVIVFILSNYAKGLLSLGSLLFGIIAGTLVSIPFGMLSLDGVGSASWFSMPPVLHFQLEFTPAAMATVAIVYVVNCIQNMGGVAMTTNAIDQRHPTDDEYTGGIVSLGIMSILGAFIGAIPQSTYEQNTGILISTHVKNRLVFVFASAVFIMAGFLPKLAAILTCIPESVIGGAVISVFATITVSGMDLIIEGGFTPRKKLIVGTAIALGLGVEQVAGCLSGPGMPEWVATVFSSSALPISAIVAVILNLVLPQREVDSSIQDDLSRQSSEESTAAMPLEAQQQSMKQNAYICR